MADTRAIDMGEVADVSFLVKACEIETTLAKQNDIHTFESSDTNDNECINNLRQQPYSGTNNHVNANLVKTQ